MPTGLFVVGSRAGDRRNLMTCNWVMQVATSPKLVAVAVESGSVTRELIEAGGSFSVSAAGPVRPGPGAPVREAGARRRDRRARGGDVRLQGEPVDEVAGGLPVLAAAVAWLACSVRSIADVGRSGARGGARPATCWSSARSWTSASLRPARRHRSRTTPSCPWATPG